MYYANMTDEEYERHFFAYPHMHGMTPLRMAGNLYFAGDDSVGIHLLDTGKGLIMLDTGYPHMRGFTIQSIWALGFRPEDVKIILHSHGHYDHIGGTNLVKALSGAKTLISGADARMMRERPELVLGRHEDSLFEPDDTLEDGDEFALGNARVRVRAAPGHTMGTLAVFLTVREGNKTYTAAMHGGVGLNTLTRAFIDRYALPDMQALYAQSLDALMDERVDITLGNHTRQNDTPGKARRLAQAPQGPNPFVDPGEWRRFLTEKKAQFEAMREREAAL